MEVGKRNRVDVFTMQPLCNRGCFAFAFPVHWGWRVWSRGKDWDWGRWLMGPERWFLMWELGITWVLSQSYVTVCVRDGGWEICLGVCSWDFLPWLSWVSTDKVTPSLVHLLHPHSLEPLWSQWDLGTGLNIWITRSRILCLSSLVKWSQRCQTGQVGMWCLYVWNPGFC